TSIPPSCRRGTPAMGRSPEAGTGRSWAWCTSVLATGVPERRAASRRECRNAGWIGRARWAAWVGRRGQGAGWTGRARGGGGGGGGGGGRRGREGGGAEPVPDRDVVVLVRHGETEWSRDGRHTSRTDLPLTDHGAKQAVALGRMLGGLRPGLGLTSPLQRAPHTAELAGLAAEPEPDLAEGHAGEDRGLATPEIRRRPPGAAHWAGGRPGGETAVEVGRRADRVLARAAAAPPSGPVVLISHGHLGRVLAARYLGLPVDHGRLFALGPAAACLLGLEHGTPVIHRWNLPNPVDA